MIRGTFLVISMLFVCALTLPRGYAALGESDSKVGMDRKSLSGNIFHQSTGSTNRYVVHAMTTDQGIVNEYATFNGTVFAITWVGYTHPDLSVLLGSHFSEFEAEAHRTKARAGRGMRRVDTGNVVVEFYGHMRKVQGRAYLPTLVPQGVDPEALQ